jgi:hypothetical protein
VESLTPFDSPPSFLWELHTTCGLKANRSLTRRSVFHICWMMIENGKEQTLPHSNWNRTELHGDTERTIGRVAGSVRVLAHYESVRSLLNAHN